MKKLLQLILLIILLIFIALFYYIYFVDDKKNIKTDADNLKEKRIDEKDKNNLIKNLRYDVNFDDNTRYSITSDLSELVYEGEAEKVVMQKVTAILINNDGEELKITSDNAIYNNLNYNTLFDTNVRIEYVTHVILSQKLDLNFDNNIVKIYDNVTYEGLDGIIETDIITINLISKNIQIFMKNSNEKVQIMSK